MKRLRKINIREQRDTYLVVFNGFQVTRHIQAGQSHQFCSQIEADVQYSSDAVRVEEWQQANVDFLVLVLNLTFNFFFVILIVMPID